MLRIRPSHERGAVDHGWLKTFHSFSFAEYQDPQFMGWRTFRVINEDIVASDQGFGTHPHRDMEIITYVISGTLEHKDSMGNGTKIPAGDVKYMSAGSGVTHSEFNPSKSEAVHLLQIWIFPHTKGLTPQYAQKNFADAAKQNTLCKIVSHDGADNSIAIRQRVNVYASILESGKDLDVALTYGGFGYVQIIAGSLTINDLIIKPGDGLFLDQESHLIFRTTGKVPAHFLVFDLN